MISQSARPPNYRPYGENNQAELHSHDLYLWTHLGRMPEKPISALVAVCPRHSGNPLFPTYSKLLRFQVLNYGMAYIYQQGPHATSPYFMSS